MINFSTQILSKCPLTNFVFYLFAFLVLCACEGDSPPWADGVRSAAFVNQNQLDEAIQKVEQLPPKIQKKVKETLETLSRFPRTATGLEKAFIFLEEALALLPSPDEPYGGDDPYHAALKGGARLVVYGLAVQTAIKIKERSDLKQAVLLLKIARLSTVLGNGPPLTRKSDPLLWEEIRQVLGEELWKKAYRELEKEKVFSSQGRVLAHFSKNKLILETFGVSASLDDVSYHAGRTENLKIIDSQGKPVKILGETFLPTLDGGKIIVAMEEIPETTEYLAISGSFVALDKEGGKEIERFPLPQRGERKRP